MIKIAIQGHPTRGKKVIQILESLGGINSYYHIGKNCGSYYKIHGNTIVCTCIKSNNYKHYTLEEFEKEFPFKVGDLCIYHSPICGKMILKILGLFLKSDSIVYEVAHKDSTKTHSYIYKEKYLLEPYKEMKEERNITLTLDKAKEWYNKGGELKEVALQAFNEKELTEVDLPKTWEEFCENYPTKNGECYIGTCCDIHILPEIDEGRDIEMDKNVCPSQKSAEAHLAMIQLEQLRNCYRGLFVTVIGMPVWCIIRYKGKLIISHRTWGTNETFLSFQSPEIAEKYLKNFEPLIKQAGDLIN